MRLLLINYEYPPVGGGAATATQAIARALVDLGHVVTVVTARSGDAPSNFTEEGVEIRRIASWRRSVDRSGHIEKLSFLLSGLIFVPGIVERHAIEGVIAFFSIPSGPIAWRARALHKVPYIISLRGGDVPGAEKGLHAVHRFLQSLRRAVLRHARAIVANSEGLREMAEAADPFPVLVVPNGVDTGMFSPPAMPREGKALRILFVGRFQSQKNVASLLRAAAQLAPGSFELRLVGDGPELLGLRALADDLNLTGAVTWSGWVPRREMPEVYRSCDCLVNPSLYEGLPNSVLEAMASGLPVIASNVPGNDALVKHGENGFLIAPGDESALVSALRAMEDQETRNPMGAAARARALELPSWREVAESYVRLFG